MAMITGRVQIEESSPRKIEVGQPFAYCRAGKWENLDGETLSHESFKLSEFKGKRQPSKSSKANEENSR